MQRDASDIFRINFDTELKWIKRLWDITYQSGIFQDILT